MSDTSESSEIVGGDAAPAPKKTRAPIGRPPDILIESGPPARRGQRHYTPAELAAMTKDDLQKLIFKLKLPINQGLTKAEMASQVTAFLYKQRALPDGAVDARSAGAPQRLGGARMKPGKGGSLQSGRIRRKKP